MPATTKIKLAEIRSLREVQPRAKMDQDTIDEYAELIQSGIELPPPVVFFDKDSDETFYYTADGFHRIAAHDKLGKKFAECIVRNGTVRDAQLFAFSANSDHGLRRTNADKRRVVELMLKDEEWAKMSDRSISKACAVSNTMVSEIRAELAGNAKKSKKSGTKDGAAPVPGAAAQDAPPPPEDESLPPADPAPAPTHCDHGKKINEECPECEAAIAKIQNGEDPELPPPDLSATPGKDMRGRECPPELAEAMTQSNAVLAVLERELHALKRRITEFGATPAGAALRVQQIDIDMGNVARAVRFARAFTTCPNHPNCANGCNTCKGRGWVVKDEFDRLPEEVKG